MVRETDGPAGTPEEAAFREVFEELEDLEGAVDSEAEREEVRDVRRALERVPGAQYVGGRIERYTTRDVAESFVGSILVSLPLLVEDGVFDIAEHFLANTLAGFPVWLAVNAAFVVVMTWGLLYWTEFRHVENTAPFLGIIPRRVVGVVGISFGTAALMMTMWGRAGWHAGPLVAVSRVSVVWTAAAFGAALGDILPGQSSGTELGDVPGNIAGKPDDSGDAAGD